MLNFLQQQHKDQIAAQKAAQEAQDKAIYQSQLTAAQQAGTVGSNEAQQQLQMMNQYQQVRDEAAQQLARQAAQDAGESQTGLYDFMQAQRQQQQNLGMASSNLPQTAANLPGMYQKNPAATTAASSLANKGIGGANQMSSASDKTKFGGY
jgi:hypothetical protein